MLVYLTQLSHTLVSMVTSDVRPSSQQRLRQTVFSVTHAHLVKKVFITDTKCALCEVFVRFMNERSTQQTTQHNEL